MVLPQFFLDNVKDHARNIIAASGVRLAAYRLPDNLFAGAKITVRYSFLEIGYERVGRNRKYQYRQIQ